MHLERGQLSISDAFVALFIALLFFSLAIAVWNADLAYINKRSNYNDLKQEAFLALNQLVLSPGYPSAWDANTVQVLGLASGKRVLSPAKLASFAALSDAQIAGLLNLREHGFLFEMYTGSALVYSKGAARSSGLAVSMERIVEFDGNLSRAELTVYD